MPRVKKTVKTKLAKSQMSKTSNLSIPVYSLLGKQTGQLQLPKEYFGAKVNRILLTQAARVYMTNQKKFTASTKTRGEVRGTTAKMYSQKGTGRARHGAKTAPVFVGGGIVFGPKPRLTRLALPKKMKKVALISSLSLRLQQKSVIGLSGLEKVSGKTRQIVGLLNKITGEKPNVLIITKDKNEALVRATRNIPGVDVLTVNLLNGYEVIKHQQVAVTKQVIESFTSKKESINE